MLYACGNLEKVHSTILPYLNDTADYTLKLSLIMYTGSVNHNMNT